MSISVDKNKCVGCKKCIEVCPGSLFELDSDNKAYIKYPKDCWGCCSCVKECKREAISLYLGADIGGRGSKLYAKVDSDIIHWKIEKSNGNIKEIEINRKDSNKY